MTSKTVKSTNSMMQTISNQSVIIYLSEVI